MTRKELEKEQRVDESSKVGKEIWGNDQKKEHRNTGTTGNTGEQDTNIDDE